MPELTEYAQQVAKMFKTWQVNSVLIVFAFLPWTIFYWINVLTYGDSRYVVPAIIMHLYWALSWIIVTLPIIYAYNKWSYLKNYILSKAIVSIENREPERTINFIKEIDPITGLQIFGAGAVTIISFLIPLINLVV